MFDRTELIRVLCTAMPILLTACGGGGGTTAATETTGPAATIDPPSLNVSLDAGQSGFATVKIVPPVWVEARAFPSYTDQDGLLDRTKTLYNSAIQADGSETYHLSFAFPALAEGASRSGTIKLVFPCARGDARCPTTEEARSVRLPYVVKAAAATGTLTPLRPLAGGSPWWGAQGNAARTGYVPATLDASKFSRRFVLAASSSGPAGSTAKFFSRLAAAGSGQALFAATPLDGAIPPGRSYQVSEATGAAQWVGRAVAWTAPAIDQVDAFRLTIAGDTILAGLKVYPYDGCNWVESGASIFAMCRGNRPVLMRITKGIFQVEWKVTDLRSDEYDYQSTLAMRGDTVYLLGSDRLEARAIADGALRFETMPPVGQKFYSDAAPVVGEDGAAYVLLRGANDPTVGKNTLARIDPATGRIAWTMGSWVSTPPVLAKGVLLVIERTRLVALDPATGKELWGWAGPWPWHSYASAGKQPGQLAPLVVVGDHAFVSTLDGVRAIDLRTRTIAWSDPNRGDLAVSDSGLLYIVGIDRLTAINLQ